MKIVREIGMLGLEDAHRRLSALLTGFSGRGVLQLGAPADIVVHDYGTLAVLPSEIVHDLKGGEWRRVQRASGYRYVLVNGAVTIENDQQTSTLPGRSLRGGGAPAFRALAA